MAEQDDYFYLELKSGHRVKIDHEDRERVQAHSWRVTTGTSGRLRVVTSIRFGKKVRTITLGKFLMDPPEGMQVYPRRFNDGLDYRKSNLIVCTLQERQRLLPKKRTETTSQYRGVSFISKTKKWRAGIEVEGRTLNLGDFDTDDEAATAYNKASLKYFGEMGYQNPVGRNKVSRKS